MPCCASDDHGATPVNTIWARLAVQALTEHIQYSTVQYSIVEYSIVQYTVKYSVLPQDVELNLAMPHLASND